MTSNEPGSSMPSSSPSTAPAAPARRRRRSRARWAVPATAVAAVAAVTAGVGLAPQIAGAVTGSLPARTPAQVLAAVAGAKAQPLSGTVVESADLGLPALPGTGSSTSLTSLLSGSHTLRVWYGSDKKERIAVVGDLAETDVVRNSGNLWLWSSSANTVEHVLLPAAKAPAAAQRSSSAFASTLTITQTPADIAAEILKTLGPTTTVTVDGTVRVAGRSTYELVLTPKDARSLVGRVTIAVDAATSMPLRVQVFARGITSPAFSTGFTSLTAGAPDASNFAFVAPPGAKVTTKDLRGAAADKAKPGAHAMSRGGAAKAGEPTVSGSGWLTVVEASGTGAAAAALGSSSTGSGGSGGTGSTSAELQTILRSATPVSGSFGAGSLIRTRLLSVLMLADGRVFAGAVVPSVLEQAAAR